MPNDRSSDLLGQLPRTRPHRRSTKRPEREPAGSTSNGASEVTGTTVAAPEEEQRAARRNRQPPARAKREASTATAAPNERLPQPAQPRGIPSAARPRRRPPETTTQSSATPILKTAVQASAELAEIGLALGTRALRRAIDRLPRP